MANTLKQTRKKTKSRLKKSLLKKKNKIIVIPMYERLVFVIYIFHGRLLDWKIRGWTGPSQQHARDSFCKIFPFPLLPSFQKQSHYFHFQYPSSENILYCFQKISAFCLCSLLCQSCERSCLPTPTAQIFLRGDGVSVAIESSCGSQGFCLQLLVLQCFLGVGEKFLQ